MNDPETKIANKATFEANTMNELRNEVIFCSSLDVSIRVCTNVHLLQDTHAPRHNVN